VKIRWRVPLALSAAVLLAQAAHVAPLMDVAGGGAPAGARLVWPLTHVLLAPFTLTADWLNGGDRADLKGFVAFALVGYVLVRLMARDRADAPTGRIRGESAAAAVFLLAVAGFFWWGVRWNRPIPRLVVADTESIVFDVHSHTSASHDGRPGFGAAQNARWHARAGFDAAFVTDHNLVGAARQWQLDRGGHPPRLLGGEELSLSGLHILVLGNDSLIRTTDANASFDASIALLDAISHPAPIPGDTVPPSPPYLIASLPEFWQHHWGPDMGRLTLAGVSGFEVWTTSPKAMDIPPAQRRTLIARAGAERRGLFGATDMHGLGNTASVWNVTRLSGWRRLDDAALTRALIRRFRSAPDSVRVVALRRWQAESRLGAAFAAPAGLFMALRGASRWHALALLAWIWLPPLLLGQRRS
jgi:hypothetical protein